MTATATSQVREPAAAGLRFANAQLRTGLRVHYAEYGDPGGEALILLHGYTDSWYSYSRLLPLLAPERYHAFAVSQRGHGDSERPAGGYAPDDFAADVVAFMDAVGVARATLVGHSMGSFVARRVAAARPDRVTRLVLIGSAVTPVNPVTRELQAAVRELADPVAEEFVREFQAGTLYLPVPEAFFERVIAESGKLPARVWRSALDGLLASDDADRLGRIAMPTLIVGGDRDAVFSREEQERLAAAIPCARLALYAETGHDPQWERPGQVAADLTAFVRGGSAIDSGPLR